MVRPLAALLAVVSLSSCGLFCDDAELSCGGSPVRSDPSCASMSGTSCNGADYIKGLFLDLPALADGSYAVEGAADGEPFSCTVTVAAGSPSVGCPGLPSNWSGGSAIEFNAVPCAVSLELRQGETVLLDETVRPHYGWSEPWGEGCDWSGYARVQLELPAGG